jgi:endonuclease/exonuclease/phosphatase family metal-dependent hydrolase
MRCGAACLAVVAAVATAAAGEAVRVVSFNLYHGGVTSARFGDGDLLERRLAMTTEQLGQIAPDVIGLQEASRGADRGDVAARLARALGHGHAHATAGYRRLGWLVHAALGFEEGPAVLSRFAILASEAREIGPCRLGYRRMLLCARVGAPGGPLDACSVHTANDACEHRELAAALRGRDASVPLVVAADLNARPDSHGVRRLLRATGLTDAFAAANPGAPGFTVGQPPRESRPLARRRVDYVLARPARGGTLRVVASRVVLRVPGRGPDGLMLWPSDHYGVVAELAFAGP